MRSLTVRKCIRREFVKRCKDNCICRSFTVECLVQPFMRGLNRFPNKPWFLHVCRTSPFKTLWGKKEKLLITSNFSYFPQLLFYLIGKLPTIFIKIKNCRLQILLVWKSIEFVVWERVKNILGLFLWGFYAVSTVFQFFKDDSSQIRVSWTIFNHYLNSPLSWHWRTSSCAIPIILSAKGESHYYQI